MLNYHNKINCPTNCPIIVQSLSNQLSSSIIHFGVVHDCHWLTAETLIHTIKLYLMIGSKTVMMIIVINTIDHINIL